MRGGGAVDPEFYRKFWATTGSIYGAQCLLAPKSMTEMHYEAKSSQMTEFWLRKYARVPLLRARRRGDGPRPQAACR